MGARHALLCLNKSRKFFADLVWMPFLVPVVSVRKILLRMWEVLIVVTAQVLTIASRFVSDGRISHEENCRQGKRTPWLELVDAPVVSLAVLT